jgi:hypothetical protein
MKAHRRALLRDIRAIRRRLSIVEKKATTLGKEKKASSKAAFQKKFPDVKINPDLFRWVGIAPPISIGKEKEAIRDAINQLYESK